MNVVNATLRVIISSNMNVCEGLGEGERAFTHPAIRVLAIIVPAGRRARVQCLPSRSETNLAYGMQPIGSALADWMQEQPAHARPAGQHAVEGSPAPSSANSGQQQAGTTQCGSTLPCRWMINKRRAGSTSNTGGSGDDAGVAALQCYSTLVALNNGAQGSTGEANAYFFHLLQRATNINTALPELLHVSQPTKMKSSTMLT